VESDGGGPDHGGVQEHQREDRAGDPPQVVGQLQGHGTGVGEPARVGRAAEGEGGGDDQRGGAAITTTEPSGCSGRMPVYPTMLAPWTLPILYVVTGVVALGALWVVIGSLRGRS
jgi:hypothetical protein